MLAHPAVAAVNVSSTAWDPAFVANLESSGLGNDGYAIPAGSSAQLQTLPWTSIDQIRITFSEDVTLAAGALSVSGVNKTAYVFSGFTYESATFTATWTLDAAIAKDKVIVDLDADGLAPVRSVSTGEVLDGAWTDCQSTFNSGNGQGGVDFEFRFNVLPGDVNGSNAVNSFDVALVSQKIGTHVGANGYVIRYDVDGSGDITSADLYAVQARAGAVLPTGSPVGATNDAPTTSGIPDISLATGTADYVLSLADFFADAETASADLAYSLFDNTNATLFDSLIIDSSGDLSLDLAAGATGDAVFTIRATDDAGLIVDTAVAVHVSDAPTIGNFYCINEVSDYWTLSGTVSDTDDLVEGYVVTFGGVLENFHLSTTVGADGVFALTVELPGLTDGTATAQTYDPHGVISNVAMDWVIA